MSNLVSANSGRDLHHAQTFSRRGHSVPIPGAAVGASAHSDFRFSGTSVGLCSGRVERAVT